MVWTIVPYQFDYTDALRLVYLQARQAAFPWVEPDSLQLLDFDQVIQGETVLVALDQGVPIGFIAWWPPDNFIHSLFVNPAWTRRGVGQSLLQACLQQLGRPASLKCKLANPQALHFYYSLGWQSVEAGHDQHGSYLLLAYRE